MKISIEIDNDSVIELIGMISEEFSDEIAPPPPSPPEDPIAEVIEKEKKKNSKKKTPAKKKEPKLTDEEMAALNGTSQKPTKEDVKQALSDYEADKGRPAKIDLLRTMGAVSDDGNKVVHPRYLDESKWAELIAACKS